MWCRKTPRTHQLSLYEFDNSDMDQKRPFGSATGINFPPFRNRLLIQYEKDDSVDFGLLACGGDKDEISRILPGTVEPAGCGRAGRVPSDSDAVSRTLRPGLASFYCDSVYRCRFNSDRDFCSDPDSGDSAVWLDDTRWFVDGWRGGAGNAGSRYRFDSGDHRFRFTLVIWYLYV